MTFDYQIIIAAVLPVFCIIFLGFGLRKFRFLSREADKTLFKLIINILIPCLIMDSILGNRALDNTMNSLVAPVVGFLTVSIGVGISFLFSPLAGLKEKERRRTFALSTGLYNWAYLALPLVIAFFDKETVGVLFVHNFGVEIAMWTVGLIVLTGEFSKEGFYRVFNPPVIAIFLALILNSQGAEEWIPDFLQKIMEMLGSCAIPMGLLLVGASFYDHIHEAELKQNWRVSAVACLMRLGLLPILFLMGASWLPLSVELKQVMVVQAAMPAAVFPIIMTKHYGGHTATALRVILATSLLGFITIPLWIQMGMKWVFGE